VRSPTGRAGPGGHRRRRRVAGGASDDGFEYFRGRLVAQGRAVYDQAVTDPDSLAGLPAVRAAAEEGSAPHPSTGPVSRD